MLVYYYLPKSYGKLGNKQIQGIATGMPPTHVTHKEYIAHRDVLVQAPFTPEYFEKVTGKPNFPYRAYITLETVKEIPYRKLQQIASYLGIEALMNEFALKRKIQAAIRNL